MERCAFLQLLCAEIGMASVATPAKALTLVAPLAGPASDPGGPPEPLAGSRSDRGCVPESSVATAEDIGGAQVETVWYRHWRRINRRHYRRVSRRVYRRHY
jgi:hypothetical protein